MEEQNNTQRRNLGEGELVTVINKGTEIVVRVLDVGPEGMRIRVPEFLNTGTEIFCQIVIYQGVPPFYVKGRIVKAAMVKDQMEADVKFDIVRVYNFFNEKKE
jgi:PilZ domain